MSEQSQTQTQQNHKHRNILKQIAPILKEVQLGENGTSSLLEKMEAIYQSDDPKVFAEVLIRIMIVPFIDAKNEHASRVVSFFHKIVTTVGRTPASSPAEDEQETDSSSNETNFTLSVHMVKLCAKYLLEQRSAVRTRICETIALLLKSIPNLKENLVKFGTTVQEKLPALLLNRLQDKIPQIRAHSARALCYLQGCDTAEKDRITNELMHHLKWDPAAEVRVTIARFGEFDADNYQYLIDKVNDLSEEVRKAALKTIADKISIDELTIQSRERILQSSLGDKSAAVNKMGERVLKEWIRLCDQNTIAFLTKLDVSFNKKTAELVLKTLFRLPTPEMFDTVDRSIFVGKFIPIQQLSPENAFYWRFVLETFSQFPSIGELLVPSIADMCAYLTEFVELFESEDKQLKAHKILPQLLKIIMKIPMEEGGRMVFMNTLLDLFTFVNVNPLSIKLMLQLFYKHHQGEQGDIEHSLVHSLEKLIKCKKFIMEPVLQEQPAPRPTPPPPQVVLEDVKALRLEIGSLIHLRHKKEKEKSLAAESQEYLRAQALQDEINSMLEEISALKTRLTRVTEAVSEPEPEVMQEDASGPEDHDFPRLALSLAFSALITHLRKVQNVSSHVRAFYDSYVTVEIMNEDPYIRKQVLTLMTLVGLICRADAADACNACVQGLIVDEQPVKVRALQCLVDLIQHYGFDEFDEDDRIADKITNFLPRNEYCDETLDSPLRSLLMYFLGYQDGIEVVRCVVTGMIKLLLANRLSAPRIVSTLFCVWINPLNESSTMYHEISTWLPMYVKMGLEQALSVADALIPCIRKIKTTSKKAYLSHAPVDRLISFVISNTDQKRLEGFVKTPESVHEKIAINMLQEMRSLETGPVYTSYARALKTLNLAGCQEEPVQLMKKRLLRLIKKANTKTMPSLKAFYKYLTCLCATEVQAGNSFDTDAEADASIYENVEVFSSSDQDKSDSDEESQDIIGATPDR